MGTEEGWLPTWPEYLPDRYDRLAGGINEIAATPEFFDSLTTPTMLRDLGGKITTDRILDGLSDRDANHVIAYTAMTFPAGIPHMVLRLGEQLNRSGPGYQPSDDEKAVASVIAQVLAIAKQIFKQL